MQKIVVVAILATAVVVSGAQAQDQGTTLVKVGAHVVAPKSDNGSLAGGALKATIDDSIRPSVMVEYFVHRDLGLEVIAAWPFEHTVNLNGKKAGSVEHLPPTVSLQYHFNSAGAVSPYVGAGLNYTLFFSEKTTGALKGTKLRLDPSFGFGLHAGIDFRVNDKLSIGVDARYLDIDSKVKVNGGDVGTVHIDPMAYGAYAQFRF